MSLYADIAYGRDTELSQQELNRRAKIIADAIEALREFVPEWEKQVDLLSTVGLNRINEALLPAYQQIIDIADLGALLTTKSTTPVTIGVGTKTFLVPEAVRLNFAPTNFLMAVAGGDFDQHMIGRLSSYDNETGVLVIQVERVSGEGEFANWQISPVATTDDLEALRDQVAAHAQTATQKAEEAVLARNQAVPAGQAAVAALGQIQASWYGPRETKPSGAALGAQYLDTSQSPNVVKVLTQDGWAPTVTVSVGGSRQQVYVATEGQTGPFVVDGGFSFGSVNVNGAEFFNGHGVTFNLEQGEFTFDAPLSAGDLVAFRGYLANDLIDIYTKDEVYSKAETDDLIPPQLDPDEATDPDDDENFGTVSGEILEKARTAAQTFIAAGGGDQSDLNTTFQTRLSTSTFVATSKTAFIIAGVRISNFNTNNNIDVVGELRLSNITTSSLHGLYSSGETAVAGLGFACNFRLHQLFSDLTIGQSYRVDFRLRKMQNSGPIEPREMTINVVIL